MRLGAGGGARRRARARRLTVAFAPLGADWVIEPPSTDPYVRQELVETVYHVVWELSHVFFEHRGLLGGRSERREPRRRRVELPLSVPERERDGSRGRARRCARLGAHEGARDRGAARADRARRAPTARSRGDRRAAPGLRARRDAARARQRRLGHRRDGHRRRSRATAARRRGCAARARSTSAPIPAIVTAIANDIGPQAVFTRQVIAYGGVGDALIAFSTSGDSRSVIDALTEARRRGLVTIALVGYDGGRVAAEGWPTTSSSAARSTSRASRRRTPPPRTCCASSSSGGGRRAAVSATRVRARVQGVVQGVGFRPFVYRLAREEQLGGFVLNDERGVVLEVDGSHGSRARASSPGSPASRRRWPSSSASTATRSSRPASASSASSRASAAATPTRSSRRTRRPATTASPSCATRPTAASATRSSTARTAGPASRSCAACRTTGRPRRWPASRCARSARPSTTIPATAASTRSRTPARPAGRARSCSTATASPLDLAAMVATPSTPPRAGWPAARCSRSRASAATTWPAQPPTRTRCATLRARKRREDRPFALMVRDAAAAAALAELGEAELALLVSAPRPIVLAPRRAGRSVAEGVAPGVPELGVMLPYAPLHHLLLDDLAELGIGAHRAHERQRLRRADRVPRRRCS